MKIVLLLAVLMVVSLASVLAQFPQTNPQGNDFGNPAAGNNFGNQGGGNSLGNQGGGGGSFGNQGGGSSVGAQPEPAPRSNRQPNRRSQPVPTQMPNPKKDPCKEAKCTVGQTCKRNETIPDLVKCECIEECQKFESPDPLCTDKNKTFNSICDFERNQCFCMYKDSRCINQQTGSYIVYYAECQGAYCNKAYDMVDYANRIAQWFRDTHAARAMIPSDYATDPNELMNPLSKKDRRISSAMYNSPDGNAIYVAWWFCDLDKNNDQKLSKQELSVLTRALMPNEQCIQTFLSQCDKDSNSQITSTEWRDKTCFNVTKAQKTCADIYKLSSYVVY